MSLPGRKNYRFKNYDHVQSRYDDVIICINHKHITIREEKFDDP